jgi:hypothetical protein
MSGMSPPAAIPRFYQQPSFMVISRMQQMPHLCAVRTTCRVDHANPEHVAIFFGLRIEAECQVIALTDLPATTAPSQHSPADLDAAGFQCFAHRWKYQRL